ncbi:endonuclease/exonuclease/phosphatase family protein [Flaviaesturariibacter aridisoli]|uniref:Endonuclease/exonuclease/phosphatase family protein n=1 Tax=Flaviaesturariibacter aridisoli TaxID=2545761 RepID=A0A4R4DXC5_9BACT|nr:endonuclease/exonuclease/phosphatase family protein [Flaviaesturariibacter aridisoli]TCZ67876.1 endonuclease/exonuclease/phosphatase family protein [Flaviaesturariibacter aridisoli]
MELVYKCLSIFLLLAALLPLIPHPHWIFRIWEYGRIQAFFLQLLVLAAGHLLHPHDRVFWFLEGALTLLALHNAWVLAPYTRFFRKKHRVEKRSESVSVLSVNVYQFNREYDRLLALVRTERPDILLTMETNGAWQEALDALGDLYPHAQKVPLENTYGMHFYTRLPLHRVQVHYFVADDMPSIEAELETPDGTRFTIFCVHPAPPSPTEEETARERDGDLLSVAKKAAAAKGPVLVVGDFNNVAWARSSVLFRKTSGLIDPRIGRGFVSTYHARYRWLRFPIDLFFHSPHLFVERFCTLRPIGSDHLPLFCRFFINPVDDAQEGEVETLEAGREEEVEEMIQEGKEEESSRPVVARE